MPVVRTDGRAGGRSVYGHVITKFSRWVDCFIFLPMVLRRRASRARAPLLHSIITSLAIFLIYNVVPGRPELFVEQNEVTVSVSWILQHKNGIIKNYEVTYVREDNYMDRRSIATNKTKHEYQDLQAGKTYEFQVYFQHHISSTANYFVSILILIIIGLLVFFCFYSHSQTQKVPN